MATSEENKNAALGCGCLVVIGIVVIVLIARGCSGDSSKSTPSVTPSGGGPPAPEQKQKPVPAGHERKQAPKTESGPTRKMEQVREEEPEKASKYESQYETVPKSKLKEKGR